MGCCNRRCGFDSRSCVWGRWWPSWVASSSQWGRVSLRGQWKRRLLSSLEHKLMRTGVEQFQWWWRKDLTHTGQDIFPKRTSHSPQSHRLFMLPHGAIFEPSMSVEQRKTKSPPSTWAWLYEPILWFQNRFILSWRIL
ncbi:hypothetical protein KUCAC02_006513 [Chaenocephalus aceratus]|uniref:Uncharacterized protein n=1 Tax=Chaenocephalus aceratus TaxID=36190 RepID=A0ACB9VTC6_CHAAC|nr:hypothetical protein KUCAC02_006513 [Chaenocephalus aceratus]